MLVSDDPCVKHGRIITNLLKLHIIHHSQKSWFHMIICWTS